MFFKKQKTALPKVGEIRCIEEDINNPFRGPSFGVEVKAVQNGYVKFGVVGVSWDNRSMDVNNFMDCYNIIVKTEE